jgi:hypothetical protein
MNRLKLLGQCGLMYASAARLTVIICAAVIIAENL